MTLRVPSRRVVVITSGTNSFHRCGGPPPSKREVLGFRRSKPAALPSNQPKGFPVAPKTLRAPSRNIVVITVTGAAIYETGAQCAPYGGRTPSTAAAVPLPRRGRFWGIRRSKPAALPSIGYRGLCGRPYDPSRALSKGCCYNVGDERARNARPYGVRRCSRRLQTHLTIAMIKPSVANASHRCDFCHVVGARIARPPTFCRLSISLSPDLPPRGRGTAPWAVEGVAALR